MSLEDLFNQVDNLNNDDFEALINHVDKQKKRRARDMLAEAQRQASRTRHANLSLRLARKGTKSRAFFITPKGA